MGSIGVVANNTLQHLHCLKIKCSTLVEKGKECTNNIRVMVGTLNFFWFSQEMHIGPSKWQSPLLLGLPQSSQQVVTHLTLCYQVLWSVCDPWVPSASSGRSRSSYGCGSIVIHVSLASINHIQSSNSKKATLIPSSGKQTWKPINKCIVFQQTFDDW
jgi:hypothetical protein